MMTNEQRDAAQLGELIEALPAREVPRLQAVLRDDWAGGWSRVRPHDVPKLTQRRHGWAAAALLSAHYDGYVREAALTELVRLEDPRSLPFVLVRMNDWVEPIRAAAKLYVRRLIVPANANAWVRCLPLVDALARSRRADHAAIVGDALELMRLHGMDALRAAVRGDDAWSRRRCTKLWLQAQPDVVLALLRHDDPGVRLLAARAMVHLRGALLEACFEVARCDRVSAVRREAFYAALDRLPSTHAALEPLLFDRNRGLRELARFYLRQASPERDFAAEYRRALKHRLTEPALNGLVETGDEEDLAALTSLRDHTEPRVRRMVVRAVAAKARPLSLVGLVADADTATSKAAARGLAHRMDESIAGALLAIVPAAPHVERHVARLLGRLGRRAALVHLLALARIATRTDYVVAALESWLVREHAGAQPYAQDDAPLRTALERARIPAELAARIARGLN